MKVIIILVLVFLTGCSTQRNTTGIVFGCPCLTYSLIKLTVPFDTTFFKIERNHEYRFGMEPKPIARLRTAFIRNDTVYYFGEQK